MRHARSAPVALLLFLMLLACSGCFGAYSSPYGSPYGSPMQGAPVQTLQPGGTYTPSPYGQPATPYQVIPQTPSQPSGPGGDGAFYNSNSSTSPQPYEGGRVPTYEDPNEIKFQPPIQPDNTAVEEFGTIQRLSAEAAGVAKVDLDAADFVAPVVVGDLAPAAAVSSTDRTLPTFAPSDQPAAPYAYDENYTWLRGVLRFDAAAGMWSMTYSASPSADDEHGGTLIVADSPLLIPFKPQAVVLLRGGLDAEQSAAASRAVFRADVIEPVDLNLP
jgi:hypothetical protein